jgi:hypothetical protein
MRAYGQENAGLMRNEIKLKLRVYPKSVTVLFHAVCGRGHVGIDFRDGLTF